MKRQKKNKNIKIRKKLLLLLGFVLFMTSIISCYTCNSINESASENAKWVGCRSSEYGIDPFPEPGQWSSYVNKMTSYYKGSKGALVWIVGTVNEKSWNCRLNFPLSDSEKGKIIGNLDGIYFSKEDENEAYLSAFDKAGFEVWLQVEPGRCDLEALAQIVMNKYKSHPCVKGFGVDVEWYNPKASEKNNNGYGTKLSDSLAKAIDEKVKAVNASYNIFVKHWDSRWLPKSYRSDMIFVNDSQMFASLEDMKEDFQDWAVLYAPNSVFFQIGYENDKHLWNTFSNPAKDLGCFLLDGLENKEQKCGIIWVDFTLRDVL